MSFKNNPIWSHWPRRTVVNFRPFLILKPITVSICKYKLKNAWMACLGFKPGAAEWYALKKPRPNSGQSYSTLHDSSGLTAILIILPTKPRSFGGHPNSGHYYTTLHDPNIRVRLTTKLPILPTI